jgi:hypothetical protein
MSGSLTPSRISTPALRMSSRNKASNPRDSGRTETANRPSASSVTSSQSPSGAPSAMAPQPHCLESQMMLWPTVVAILRQPGALPLVFVTHSAPPHESCSSTPLRMMSLGQTRSVLRLVLGHPGRSCRCFQLVIERGQRQPQANCQLEIRGIVSREIVRPGDMQNV